jgi:hypothetical protein
MRIVPLVIQVHDLPDVDGGTNAWVEIGNGQDFTSDELTDDPAPTEEAANAAFDFGYAWLREHGTL